MNKGRGCGSWVIGGLVAIPLGAALLYWSWCWGWWARDNPTLQFLLQCQCPRASEEARQPDNLDVLVSACQDPYYNGVSVSPSGRFTVFIVRRPAYRNYLYDRRTDTFAPTDLGGGFLTDEIAIRVKHVSGEVYEYFLIDLTGRTLVQLNLIPMPVDFSFDPVTLKAFQQADKVYVFPAAAVALAPDFQQHPEANFILEGNEILDPNAEQKIIKVLEENGLKFEILSQGPISILPAPDMYLMGGEGPSPGIVRVSRPLLRLRMPLEELDPSARSRVEAHRAQEATDKRNAKITFVIGIVVLITPLAIMAFAAFRSIFGQPSRT